MTKKLLAVLLSALLLLSAATMSVSAENLSGKCGEGVQWSLNTIRGNLTVYGHGAMDDYFTHDQPWGSNAKSIVSVEIGEGVTHIGDYAFSDTETAWVQLPQSLCTIGNYAFRSCDKLKSVSIPDGVRTLNLNAFDACTTLTSIHISRYTQTIIGGIDTKVTICSTSADCAAALYAAEKGYSFEVCTHAEHTHQYADTVTMPTCEQKGFTSHTCTICGDSYTDSETDALGHDWQETSRAEAKCEQNGSIQYVCSHDASHTKRETIPATGHTYTDAVTAPTCEGKGCTTHTCKNCGDGIADSDLCAILSNALDNAIERSRASAPCTIRVPAHRKPLGLTLTVRNPVTERVDLRAGNVRTKKQDKQNHGFGVANIRRAAEKYGGFVKLGCTDTEFTITIGLIFKEAEK